MAKASDVELGLAAPSSRETSLIEISEPEWQRFVAQSRDALPYHDPHWTRLLARAYDLRAFAIVVKDPDGTIRAGLPLIEATRPLGRPRWVSLPFTDFCPPLARSEQDIRVLLSAVESRARDRNVSAVEIRADVSGPTDRSSDAVMHTLALDADPEALFHSFHRSQVQRNIRRAEREGVLVRSAERESELTDLFYELHCATRRRLGVPVQPRRFFRLLWEEILESGRGFVLIADVDGAPAAAAVFLTSPSTVTYKYGASDSRHWSKRPNHALFWAAIRIACERGCQAFDFGRTDLGDHGLRQFKLGWATDEQPLVYSFLCGARPGSAAKRSVSAQLLQPVIRRSPLFVSRALGALLYKYSA